MACIIEETACIALDNSSSFAFNHLIASFQMGKSDKSVSIFGETEHETSTESGSVSNEIEHETSREGSVIDIPGDLTPFLLANVSQPGERCIYKVHKRLRDTNPAAYTPKMVSICPLHHGNKELVSMEKHKLIYLAEFCERTGKKWTELAERIQTQKERICDCYELQAFKGIFASPGPADNMVHMILLDSIFIIELFSRGLVSTFNQYSFENDFIISKPCLMYTILQDLIMLENQLPYFVLDDLYKFACGNNNMSFYRLTCLNLADFISPVVVEKGKTWKSTCDCFSTLSRFWVNTVVASYKNHKYRERQPQHEAQDYSQEVIKEYFALVENFEGEEYKHFTDLVRRFRSYNQPTPKISRSVLTSYNATKLHEAGVKFKVSPNAWPLNIRFEKRTLIMPRFTFVDETECVIRNLMAFEQHHNPNQAYICNYIILLDSLIDTENDVDLFVRKGIISHEIGHNEAVAKLLNNLSLEITYSQFCYSDIASSLNAHYENCWNKTIAKLRHVYFSDLWRGTGTVAAFVLLVLTFIQTIKAFK